MAIERFEPFREMTGLREAMNRLFEDSFVWPRRELALLRRDSFPLDLKEQDDAFEVRAELPGIKPEDIHVSVAGNTLTIRGETKEEAERKEDRWIVRERRTGAVTRTLTLPTPVQSDKAEARFEQGVLVLKLPKQETAKSQSIPVRT
jgi:HSP20 family protein